LNESGRDAHVMVDESSPATMVTDLFASGVHHVTLSSGGASDAISSVVTQSDLLRWLAVNLVRGESKALGEKPIKSLGLGATTCKSSPSAR
jgi:hypothetical protein